MLLKHIRKNAGLSSGTEDKMKMLHVVQEGEPQHSDRGSRGCLYLVEATHEALCLLYNAPLYPPFHHPLDVLLLVLLCHWDIGTPWL